MTSGPLRKSQGKPQSSCIRSGRCHAPSGPSQTPIHHATFGNHPAATFISSKNSAGIGCLSRQVIARHPEPNRADHVIKSRMGNRNSIYLLGIRESVTIPDTNLLEFEGARERVTTPTVLFPTKIPRAGSASNLRPRNVKIPGEVLVPDSLKRYTNRSKVDCVGCSHFAKYELKFLRGQYVKTPAGQTPKEPIRGNQGQPDSFIGNTTERGP